MRTIGIVLTVLSFTLTVDIKDKEKLSRSWLIFTVVAALANGGIGITQKIFGMQTFSIEKKSFVACSYAIAFLVAIVIYLLTCSQKKENNNFKFTSSKTYIFAIAVGVILAVFQWLNTYAISIMDGSFLFPLYSGGSIILSTLVGILFFKDKLTKSQKYSITLGIIAVIIMNI
jgi:multidrug transporter EmrE-like cation transporter